MQSKVVSFGKLTQDELGRWDNLCTEVEDLHSPFFSAYFSAAIANHADVYVCKLVRGDKVAGFFPFQFSNPYMRALRAGEAVGRDFNAAVGIIAEPGTRVCSSELLRRAGLSYFYFTDLDARQLAYGLTADSCDPGPVVSLTPDYWDWWSREHLKFARDTARLERQVVRDFGPMRFTFSEPNWNASLSQLMAYKSAQYRTTKRADLLVPEAVRRFFETLMANQRESCCGVLSTLYAGDIWLGSHLGLRSRTVLSYWFPVYNPELRRYAPGRLLLKQMLAACCAEGIRSVDLGRGATPAKLRFANAERDYWRAAWFLPDPRAIAVRAFRSLQWRLQALGS